MAALIYSKLCYWWWHIRINTNLLSLAFKFQFEYPTRVHNSIHILPNKLKHSFICPANHPSNQAYSHKFITSIPLQSHAVCVCLWVVRLVYCMFVFLDFYWNLCKVSWNGNINDTSICVPKIGHYYLETLNIDFSFEWSSTPTQLPKFCFHWPRTRSHCHLEIAIVIQLSQPQKSTYFEVLPGRVAAVNIE